jgi:uncharacterized membrane protein YhaH (DUF805 family)
MDMMFCYGCGKQLHKTAQTCPGCGAIQQGTVALAAAGVGTGEEAPQNWYIGPLKKYVTFSGRARRKEFWYFTLFSTLISIGFMIVGLLLNVDSLLNSLYNLAVFLPTVAVGVRRLHDTGRSGWWYLLPIVNLIFWAQDGESGPNKYGEDPKQV